MKSVVIFFVLLFIGAIGGLAASEIKSMFTESEVVSVNNSSVPPQDNEYFEELQNEIEELKKINKINEKRITELENSSETSGNNVSAPKNFSNRTDPSDGDSNIQMQVNELRGKLKALEQQLTNKVEEQVKEISEQQEKEKREKMQRNLADLSENLKKGQLKMSEKHAEKLRNVLGLTDNQYQNIKNALIERSEKMSEMMTGGSDNKSGGITFNQARMDEIQKEWEDSARSILSPNQYDDFIKKKLNKVPGPMIMTTTIDGVSTTEGR